MSHICSLVNFTSGFEPSFPTTLSYNYQLEVEANIVDKRQTVFFSDFFLDYNMSYILSLVNSTSGFEPSFPTTLSYNYQLEVEANIVDKRQTVFFSDFFLDYNMSHIFSLVNSTSGTEPSFPTTLSYNYQLEVEANIVDKRQAVLFTDFFLD